MLNKLNGRPEIDTVSNRHPIQMFSDLNSVFSLAALDGDTPLHVAARQNLETIVVLLTRHPACRLHALNAWGLTPLQCAAAEGHVGVVRALVNASGDAGDDADRKLSCEHAQTAFALACRGGHLDTVKYLLHLDHKDVSLYTNDTDTRGRSLLHDAVQVSQNVASRDVTLASFCCSNTTHSFRHNFDLK